VPASRIRLRAEPLDPTPLLALIEELREKLVSPTGTPPPSPY
jgi:hypothetical protein